MQFSSIVSSYGRLFGYTIEKATFLDTLTDQEWPLNQLEGWSHLYHLCSHDTVTETQAADSSVVELELNR